MDIPIQVWYMMDGGGSDAGGLQRTSYDARTHNREPTSNHAKDGKKSEQVGMKYPEIPDSRFVVQPVKDFLIPWWESGWAENGIAKDEDEMLSETFCLRTAPHNNHYKLEQLCVLKRISWTLDSSLINIFCK